MKLLVFYVTALHLSSVKQAIFSAGGGAYGEFTQCAWAVLGDGQYQAAGDSVVENPEYKVEILCQAEKLNTVIAALREAHPCDEPAYYVLDTVST